MISKIFAMILLAVVAQAGQERGNGGDAVVCYDPATKKIVSVELLDLAEGRLLNKMKYDFIDSQDYIAIAKKQVDKMKALSPRRHKIYQEKLDLFESESVIVHGVTLKDIDDSDHRIIPKNCEVEQLIEQREPSYPGDKRYTINGDLWDLMPVSHKAATATHEIFYWEISSPTSAKVRRINALLNSTNFASINSELWLVHQIYSGVPVIEYEGNEMIRMTHQVSKEITLWGGRSFNGSQDSIVKPFGIFKGRDYSGFGQIQIEIKCNLQNCQFGKRKATYPLSTGVGKKLGLDIADDLIPDEVVINEKNQFESLLLRAYKTGTPFLFQKIEWLLKARTQMRIEFKDGKASFVQMVFDYGKLLEIGANIKGHEGTQNVILEDGELKIVYANGEATVFPVADEMNSEAKYSVLQISSSGQILSVRLRGNWSGEPINSYVTQMTDGTSQRICEGERIQFDENLKVKMDPEWKVIVSSYSHIQKCLGHVRK